MIPQVVGLDLSLRSSGIARADGTVAHWLTEPLRGPARLDYLRGVVLEATAGADLAMIEGYAFGARGRALLSLAELGGVVRCALWRAGVAYYEVAPALVKSYATGNGAASKDAMVAAAQRHLGYGGDSDDEADALWLRALGRAVTGWPVAIDMPSANAAAVDAWWASKRPVLWVPLVPTEKNGGTFDADA